jgi:outer membrane protein insertion porin family
LRIKLVTTVIIITWAACAASAPQDDSHVYGRTVAEIRIVGLKTTRPYVVERELATKVGDPFTKENEKKDYERLDRLGIFSEIKIYTALGDDGLVVFVEVRETFAYLPVVNLSISDENGVSAGGGFKSVNLLGRAIQFSGVARFGGETTVEVFLVDPWVTGNRIGYRAEYYHRERSNVIQDFYEKADEAYLRVGGHIGEYGRTGVRIWYHGVRSDVEGNTLSLDNSDHVIYGGIYIGYDTRDSASNPRSGWWSSVDVERSGLLQSESDFWRINLDFRRFLGLSSTQTVGMFSLLTKTSGKVGVEVAPWQTFGLGGSNSLRGYDVGTKVGKNQWLNTVEYRWNFIGPRPFSIYGFTASIGVQLAFFADFGTAWNTDAEFGPNFLAGGGTGIRLILPYVGMVRFDFGFGQEDPWMIFHIATDEKAVRQRERVR